ncbi:hypothetical protein ACQP00_19895 [Dactylosporangium sp. CS-047395]|uniref:hypothetical protein n=1 Tax=Dactylosporangium sp. CS-047395 TaxID=3239936 RepID=UPI003D911BED
MSERNTVLRSMHDAGLATWFGGSLMGAVGLNGAAATADDPTERLKIASAGWGRWTPVNATAIGSHLVGAAGLLASNADRVAGDKRVAAMSATKTGLTVAALAATAYSRVLGRTIEKAGGAPVQGVTESDPRTPSDLGAAQRRLRVVQWSIPVLTGALLAISALAGEQQKTTSNRPRVWDKIRMALM